jgi:hypothetical protein
MVHELDDFLCEVQPEELQPDYPEDWGLDERFETDNHPDAPDDYDWMRDEGQWEFMNGGFPDEE